MLDAEKRAALNVFLAIADDRIITGKRLKFGGYDAWYDTKHLERPLYDMHQCSNGMWESIDRGGSRGTTTEFCFEYYRLLLFTSLGKHFAWGVNSTLELPGYVLLFPLRAHVNDGNRKAAKDIDQSRFSRRRRLHLPDLGPLCSSSVPDRDVLGSTTAGVRRWSPRNRLLVCLNQSRTRSRVILTVSPTARLSQSGISTLPARGLWCNDC